MQTKEYAYGVGIALIVGYVACFAITGLCLAVGSSTVGSCRESVTGYVVYKTISLSI